MGHLQGGDEERETRKASGTGPALVVSDVGRRFGGLQALTGVNAHLERGKVTALVGPNGAGKTTLFNVISGLVRPDSGSVVLNAREGPVEISSLTPHLVARRGVTRTFQDLRLIADASVLENVVVALDPPRLSQQLARAFWNGSGMARDIERAADVIEQFGLFAYRDVVVSSLSYAQQKLVGLARAVAMEGTVLLLDEPTSGLDPPVQFKMMELVRDTLTVFEAICIVEHSVDVVRSIADTVVFMDQGRVEKIGTVEEILEDERLVDLYFGE